MSKENQKSATQLAETLFKNAQSLSEWDLQDILLSLENMHEAYLISPMADVTNERRNVIFNQSLVVKLLKELQAFPEDAFHDLANLKIQAPCTETA